MNQLTRLTRTLLILLLAALILLPNLILVSVCSASTVQFTTGWSSTDGHGLAVGPVTLTIDGTPRTAFDYTLDFFASPGDVWTATLTTLPSLPPYFSSDPLALLKDSAVTWIAQDFTTASTNAQLISDQYAIYGIFALDAPINAASILETTSAYTRASSGPAPGWVFVDSPPSNKVDKQGFVTQISQAPEPTTIFLLPIAAGFFALLWYRREQAARRGDGNRQRD
jgi:hypothetical protein